MAYLKPTQQTTSSADHELLTAQELADWLKVDLRTVYRYVHHKHMPYLWMGGRWRFKRAEVEAWMRERVPQERPQLVGNHHDG